MAKRPCARVGCPNLVMKGYCDGCAPKYSLAARQLVRKAALLSTKWYNSARWKATRDGYFREHPLCADIFKRHGVLPVRATDLDHIKPHREDWTLFWDRNNWQGLCHSCHSHKTATEDSGFGRNAKVVDMPIVMLEG